MKSLPLILKSASATFFVAGAVLLFGGANTCFYGFSFWLSYFFFSSLTIYRWNNDTRTNLA
jgi:hypothetical protein